MLKNCMNCKKNFRTENNPETIKLSRKRKYSSKNHDNVFFCTIGCMEEYFFENDSFSIKVIDLLYIAYKNFNGLVRDFRHQHNTCLKGNK